MNRKSGLILTILMALVLTACASKKEAPVAIEDDTTSTLSDADSRNAKGAFGLDEYSLSDLERLGINGDPLNYTTLYFEYNSSAMDERSRVIATRHAQHLGQQGGAQVNLEGHADERGTRDYNLALGERRAQTVSQVMNAVNSASTIQTISYGEERPADPAHNEAAWQANRRVEIKY